MNGVNKAEAIGPPTSYLLPVPKIKMTAEDDIGDILDEIDRNLSGVKQGMKDSCMNYGSEVQVQVHV